MKADEVYAILKKRIEAGGGTPGPAGIGISKIEKTETVGLVDTYTITLTNNQTYTFTVTNGSDGDSGDDGITPTIGENGNWFLGDEDTGKPSRGENATDEQVYDALKKYIENLNYDLITELNQFDSNATITPTAYGNALIEQIEGDTWQQESNGYQLFDASKLSTYSAGGATVTNNGDGSFAVSGSGNLTQAYNNVYEYNHEEAIKMLKVGMITLKPGNVTPRCYVTLFKGADERYFQLSHNQLSAEITEEMLQDCKMRIQFYANSNDVIVSGTIKPMLYQDGTGEWEPFTGGQPAPSPEYPQHIYGLGDTGYFDGVWKNGAYAEVNGDYIPGTGKEYVCNVNPIRVNPNDSVTIQYAENIDYILCGFYKEDMTYIKSEKAQGADVLNCTAPLESYWMNVTLQAQFMDQPPITIDVTKVKHCTVLINNNYATKLETRGKNLIDFDKYYGAYGEYGEYSGYTRNLYAIKIGIPKECIGKTLTLSALLKLTSPVSYLYVCADVNGVKKQGNVIRSTDYELSKITFTPQTTNDYIFIDYGSADGTIYIKDPQLEIGESSTDYTPYQHSLSYLPISSPLYEGDQIVKIGSEYKVRHENGVSVFDGSEDEGWYVNQYTNLCAYIAIPSLFRNNDYLHCDYFKTYDMMTGLSDGTIGISIEGVNEGSDGIFIGIKGIAASVEEWRAWLQSNPITVVYKSKIPIYEEIPQEPFYNLMAGEEVTTIQVLGENDNLELNNKVRFPRHTDGAIVTTGFSEAKKNSILLEEQAQTLEQRIQTLEILTLEGE